MKKILLLVAGCAFSGSFYGQSLTEPATNSPDSTVYTKVDVEATYRRGDIDWRHFLTNNINHMVLVEQEAPDGIYTVYITFIIKADGSLTNIECENYPGYGVCEEGIRVIKKSKKWRPAKLNGKAVNSFKRQPISLAIRNG